MKLFEIKEDTPESERDLALSMIMKQCRPFLSQCGGKAIFRGMTYKNDELKLAVRTDRKPTSTPLFVHNALDGWFDKKFGIKARSAALFATGDFKIASNYGGNLQKVYAVFPVGDFEFVWSKKVGDLFLEVEEVLFNNYDDDELAARKLDDDDLVADIEAFMETKDYQTDNLPLAIGSKNEVMIACKQYYAIRVDSVGQANSIVKKLMK